ncbi:Vacuolar protein sorting-associated protein 54 [Branchiostoma belcheri]|nr:Vacuolar protein sorting-associated protein 54 [Branchiostoma belcheri]
MNSGEVTLTTPAPTSSSNSGQDPYITVEISGGHLRVVGTAEAAVLLNSTIEPSSYQATATFAWHCRQKDSNGTFDPDATPAAAYNVSYVDNNNINVYTGACRDVNFGNLSRATGSSIRLDQSTMATGVPYVIKVTGTVIGQTVEFQQELYIVHGGPLPTFSINMALKAEGSSSIWPVRCPLWCLIESETMAPHF